MYTSRANPVGYSPSGGDDPFRKFQEGQRAEKVLLAKEKQTLCKEMFDELNRNDRGFAKEQIHQIYNVCLERSDKIDKSHF